jgi:hypothetical protein
MTPCWFAVDQIPFDLMWQDDAHWLPRALTGECVQGRFTFGDDNETLTDVEVQPCGLAVCAFGGLADC